MKSKKGFKDAGMIIGILALILFGIVIYSTAQPSTNSAPDADENGNGETNYSVLLFSAEPREMEALGDVASDTDTEIIEEFTIEGIPEEQTTRLLNEGDIAKIEQSAFSGSDWVKVVELDQRTVEASLVFDIEDVSGADDVIVYLNGQKVASKNAETGKVITVDLPASKLKLGGGNDTSENEIKISIPKPSWLAFWRTDSIRVKDIIITQNIFKTELAKQSFKLEERSSEEVMGIDKALLELTVDLIDDAESKKLIMMFQNKTVYASVPSVHETIKEELQVVDFDTENNLLDFETEMNGGYKISGKLELTILNINESSYRNYKITIGENVWPKIENCQAGKDYETEFYMRKSSGGDSIKVWINNHRMEYSFVNDKLSAEVCNYLEKGENSIRIIAKDRIYVDTLKLALMEK